MFKREGQSKAGVQSRFNAFAINGFVVVVVVGKRESSQSSIPDPLQL